jgi:hypothetical protein
MSFLNWFLGIFAVITLITTAIVWKYRIILRIYWESVKLKNHTQNGKKISVCIDESKVPEGYHVFKSHDIDMSINGLLMFTNKWFSTPNSNWMIICFNNEQLAEIKKTLEKQFSEEQLSIMIEQIKNGYQIDISYLEESNTLKPSTHVTKKFICDDTFTDKLQEYIDSLEDIDITQKTREQLVTSIEKYLGTINNDLVSHDIYISFICDAYKRCTTILYVPDVIHN